MNDEMKAYQISQKFFSMRLLWAILTFILAIMTIFKPFPFIILGIIMFILGFLLIGFLYFFKHNPPIIITNDKIIITYAPGRSIVDINFKDINQIEKKSKNDIIIWYKKNKDITNKQRLPLYLLNEEHQIEVVNHIENKISPHA